MRIAYFPLQTAQNSGPVYNAVLNCLQARGFRTEENSMTADAAVIWSVLWHGRMSANELVYRHYRNQNKPPREQFTEKYDKYEKQEKYDKQDNSYGGDGERQPHYRKQYEPREQREPREYSRGGGNSGGSHHYENNGGLIGLKKALNLASAEIVNEVTESGLRGRGGAGFPAGIKWKTVLNTTSDQKYVCCNADEGDSGTFADRMLMEGDPFTLIEGMTIAAIATGATKGFIYIRSEYPAAIKTMTKAIEIALKNNLLGKNILNSGKEFNIEIRVGAGSYVCGEETAMLESLEGKRGVVRAKPPLPAIEGLFGKPTIINNVLTLASVPMVLAQGANFYKSLGTEKSKGTQVFQLAGNIKQGGIFETAFGITLNELVNKYGKGTLTGKKIKAR